MPTLQQIIEARTPTELFPDRDKANKAYNRLLQIAHPDMYGDATMKIKAQEAFIKLNRLWEQYNGKVNKTNVIKTRKHEYVPGKVSYIVNNTAYLEATYDAGHQKAFILIPNNSKDNDLNENASQNLKELLKETPLQYKPFYPEHLEAFKYNINNQTKQLQVISLPDKLFTLAQVKEDYPEGLNGRDIAWMFKRILIAIANSHDQKFIHGAINLDTILIQPEQHGVVLVGWEYSIEKGDYLKAIPQKYKNLYPDYVFKKETTPPSLDILLAAKTMEQLFGPTTPVQLKTFFKGCQLSSLPHPAQLLQEFDELLVRLYGPKKFHEFKMRRD